MYKYRYIIQIGPRFSGAILGRRKSYNTGPSWAQFEVTPQAEHDKGLGMCFNGMLQES